LILYLYNDDIILLFTYFTILDYLYFQKLKVDTKLVLNLYTIIKARLCLKCSEANNKIQDYQHTRVTQEYKTRCSNNKGKDEGKKVKTPVPENNFRDQSKFTVEL